MQLCTAVYPLALPNSICITNPLTSTACQPLHSHTLSLLVSFPDMPVCIQAIRLLQQKGCIRVVSPLARTPTQAEADRSPLTSFRRGSLREVLRRSSSSTASTSNTLAPPVRHVAVIRPAGLSAAHLIAATPHLWQQRQPASAAASKQSSCACHPFLQMPVAVNVA